MMMFTIMMMSIIKTITMIKIKHCLWLFSHVSDFCDTTTDRDLLHSCWKIFCFQQKFPSEWQILHLC